MNFFKTEALTQALDVDFRVVQAVTKCNRFTFGDQGKKSYV